MFDLQIHIGDLKIELRRSVLTLLVIQVHSDRLDRELTKDKSIIRND